MEDKNFIKVYFADFSVFDEATISARICEISEERRARIEKAARMETKLELLASGLLAKKAVSIVFGIENPEFVKNEFGKPYIAGHCFRLPRELMSFRLPHFQDVPFLQSRCRLCRVRMCSYNLCGIAAKQCPN